MIDRRNFAKNIFSTILVASVVCPICVSGRRMSSYLRLPEASLPGILRSLFTVPERVDAIGIACLRALPEVERKRDRLSNILLRSVLRGTNATTNTDELRRLLVEQVRHDFATGTILSVDNWLLSLTEVRVYALSALG